MTDACPLPSADERHSGEIRERAEAAMMRKVFAALDAATEQARDELAAAGLAMEPPPRGYFASVLHQKAFCSLCGADPDSFVGGNPAVATAVLKNMRDIARHHWQAAV